MGNAIHGLPDRFKLRVPFPLEILMATAMPPQQPTPERFFNAMNAHQQTEALKTAVDLEVFTAIAEGNGTAAAIAKRCGASERGVRTLCDFLTIHGFLTKDGTQYGLAADTAVFLNRKSPAYIGGAMEFMLNPHAREGFGRLTEAVRRGGTAMGEGGLVAENPDWVTFARAMMPLMRMPAQMMAAELRQGGEVHKVLDIAAGHGMYGVSVAKENRRRRMRRTGRTCWRWRRRMRRRWGWPIAIT